MMSAKRDAFWMTAYISSHSAKQTPALTLSSVDVDFVRKIATISPRIFSPDLRHNSVVVRAAVYLLLDTEP